MKIKIQIVGIIFVVGVAGLALAGVDCGNPVTYSCGFKTSDGAPSCDSKYSSLANDCVGATKSCCNKDKEISITGN